MNVTIRPAELHGEIKAVASKSFAHRLLILSALSDKSTVIGCPESSEDIEATVRCLTALGAKVTRTPGGFSVIPADRTAIPANRVLDCGESGSTLRFLLPVACALKADAVFEGRGRLPQRPVGPLLTALAGHGCTLSSGEGLPLRCGGHLKGGTFTVPANISSQFISGLLLALPLLPEKSLLKLTGDIESKNYIEMTLSAMRMFGTEIGFSTDSMAIEGGGEYRSPGTIGVEGDWSNAAFWLCAGAMGRTGVRCLGLDLNSAQGDKAVLGLLKAFGAEITADQNGVAVKGSGLRGTVIDAKDIPDLVPVLAAVASVAEGKTVIKNAARLRIKESDRLKAVAETLSALGSVISETGDGLVITGQGRLKGGTVDSYGDHRIAMTAAVASAVCSGPVTIGHAESVRKSYPGFFTDFRTLNGNFEMKA